MLFDLKIKVHVGDGGTLDLDFRESLSVVYTCTYVGVLHGTLDLNIRECQQSAYSMQLKCDLWYIL